MPKPTTVPVPALPVLETPRVFPYPYQTLLTTAAFEFQCRQVVDVDMVRKWNASGVESEIPAKFFTQCCYTNVLTIATVLWKQKAKLGDKIRFNRVESQMKHLFLITFRAMRYSTRSQICHCWEWNGDCNCNFAKGDTLYFLGFVSLLYTKKHAPWNCILKATNSHDLCVISSHVTRVW